MLSLRDWHWFSTHLFQYKSWITGRFLPARCLWSLRYLVTLNRSANHTTCIYTVLQNLGWKDFFNKQDTVGWAYGTWRPYHFELIYFRSYGFIMQRSGDNHLVNGQYIGCNEASWSWAFGIGEDFTESAIRVYVREGSIIQSDETPTPRSRVTKSRVAR